MLVKPYRLASAGEARALRALATAIPNLDWIAPTLSMAAHAARLRGTHRLRTMDAIQAATALEAHATCLVTNDTDLRRIDGLDIVLLNNYA